MSFLIRRGILLAYFYILDLKHEFSLEFLNF